MKITKLSLCVSVVGLLAALPSAYANEIVTNCTQVITAGEGDPDSTPGNMVGSTVAEDDESCTKITIPFDYGDAPDPTYVTTDQNNGARHQLGTDVYLGQCVDADSGSLQGGAVADDNDAGSPTYGNCSGPNDEDGVVIGTLHVGDGKDSINVDAHAACKLNAWIDWNADGDWADTAEHIFLDQALPAGSNSLTVSVPAFAVEGATYARFRCSTAGGDGIGGEAADGEVEDYKVSILPSVNDPVAVGNRIWMDTNGDGIQDEGEAGLAGATVTLTDTSGRLVTDLDGQTVDAQVTAEDGLYYFGNLPEGDYLITVEPPAGYTLTLGGLDVDEDSSDQDSNCRVNPLNGTIETSPFTLSAGMEPGADEDGDDANGNMTVDCGFYGPVSVGNYIWLDANADGQQGEDEPGVQGVTVSLLDEDGITPATNLDGQAVAPVVTGADGLYRFSNLKPGNYIVAVDGAAGGYTPTQGGADPDEDTSDTDSNCKAVDGSFQTSAVTLMPNTEPGAEVDGDDESANSTVDCGLIRSVGLGSRIWIDLDGDGIRDEGEPGVPGATIILLTPDGAPATDIFGNPVPSQTTDSDGNYFFGNLREGSYVVKVKPPAGYAPTKVVTDPNNDDGSDSNGLPADDGSVVSQPLELKWGEEPDGNGSTNLTIGFGFIPAMENVPIPTLSQWGMAILSLLLSAVAFFRRRRDA